MTAPTLGPPAAASSPPPTRHPHWRLRWIVPIAVLLVFVPAIFLMLNAAGIAPRRLAPYIEQRAAGHNPTIVAFGQHLGRILRENDRGPAYVPRPIRLSVGAPPGSGPGFTASVPTTDSASRMVPISSTDAARAALATALPGDAITFAPGTYRFHQPYVEVRQAGSPAAPITVRAAVAGTVTLELDTNEGFLVSAPYWQFENLTIKGVCADDGACEHAFHVVGKASHFTARNNTISDFNAHFKINGADASMPDDGRIEGNTLTNTHIRMTDTPVTLIDLVAASNWIIRKNLLTDFIKGAGDGVSYGAYAKGAGGNNRFDNNIVICEYLLRSPAGARVGLSLGGGGTGPAYCRDGRCGLEQDGSAIRGNLIASCSDDGIYLNRASASRIVHNTLVDTGGIAVRFKETRADLEGNLVDGMIHARDGATLHETDDISTSAARLFLGSHPVRRLLGNPAGLRLAGSIPKRAASVTDAVPDLCSGRPRVRPAYGAFDDFRRCLP
jgi:hypothetical protein